MLPPALIDEFWATVRQVLRTRFQLGADQIPTAVSTYRAALDRHEVGDWIYHRDPECVAETIDG